MELLSDFQFGLVIGVFITLSMVFALRAFQDIMHTHKEQRELTAEEVDVLERALRNSVDLIARGRREK